MDGVDIVKVAMVIRQAQVDALCADVKRRFEDEMVLHLRIFATWHCEILTEQDIRQVIRLGCDNSKQYGFTLRGPVRYFVELMFMFGGYFDTDIQYPWATQALNDPLTPAEMFRADALYQEMIEYLRQVSGPENAYFKSALRATRQLALEPIAPGADFRSALATRMVQVYPEKCAWLGEELLCSMVDGSLTRARERGITSVRGSRLFAVLGFTLGHRFADDPLYPWIANTIDDTGIADPNIRVEKLEAKTLLYLETLLRHLEKN